MKNSSGEEHQDSIKRLWSALDKGIGKQLERIIENIIKYREERLNLIEELNKLPIDSEEAKLIEDKIDIKNKALNRYFNEYKEAMNNKAEAESHLRQLSEKLHTPIQLPNGKSELENKIRSKYYDKSWALVIGINDYINGLPPLTTARNDAKELCRLLKEKLGFEESRIIPLIDEQASRYAIMEQLLTELPNKVHEKDQLIFFFAGHGKTRETVKKSKIGYLIPQDAHEARYHEFIDMDDLRKACQRIPAKHILLILDCCFSGIAAIASRGEMNYPPIVDDAYMEKIIERDAWQVMTAGASDQLVADSGLRSEHSPFSGALLKGLDGAACPDKNNLITASQLYAFVKKQVLEETNRGGGEIQIPFFNYIAGSQDGEYIFLLDLGSDEALIKKDQPSHVPKMIEEETKHITETSDDLIHILHLSDLHIDNDSQAKIYRSQLEDDLKKEQNIERLEYLVISGDIANHATEDEYKAALNMVKELVDHFGIEEDHIIIAPGNHDLNWKRSKDSYKFWFESDLPQGLPEDKEKYYQSGEVFGVRDDKLYQQRFASFSSEFYKPVHKGKEYPLEVSKQAILIEQPDDRILFLSLNSAWQIDHHFKNRSGINPDALTYAIDCMQNGRYDGWLKIAVWHHPITGGETMNNEFMERLNVHGFQVCMHGHIHEAIDGFHKYDDNRGIRVIGAGTFGAPTREQVAGIPLQYNLIAFNPRKGEMIVNTRKKEKPDGAWSADARWVDKNNPKPSYCFKIKNYQPGN